MRVLALLASALSAALMVQAAVPAFPPIHVERDQPSRVERDEPHKVELVARQSTTPIVCNPGTFRCNVNNIEVCNSSRNWQLSAICNGGCCRQSGSSAFCIC